MTTDFMSGAREGPRGELRLQRPDAGAGACEGRTPRVEPRRRSGQEQFLSAHRVTPLPASPLLAGTFRFLPRKYVLLVRLESWYYWPENWCLDGCKLQMAEDAFSTSLNWSIFGPTDLFVWERKIWCWKYNVHQWSVANLIISYWWQPLAQTDS